MEADSIDEPGATFTLIGRSDSSFLEGDKVMMSHRLRILTILLVALGMLSWSGAALADDDYPPDIEDPVEDPEVGGELEEEPEEDDPGTEEPNGTPQTEPEEIVEPEEETVVLGVSLPRTGTSVVLISVLGVSLIGLGVLLIGRRRTADEFV